MDVRSHRGVCHPQAVPARNRHLPRHLSWPLTSTDVRTALGEQMSEVKSLSFNQRCCDDGTLLSVYWTPVISSNYGSGYHPSFWSSVRISISPLPATARAAARQALRAHALPELSDWITEARRAPDGWTLTRHQRSWRLAGHATAHSDDGQPFH